jgi:DNA-binding NtrC family response regulator
VNDMLTTHALRVLVADHESDGAGWLRSLLEQHGYDVRTAGDGRTAEVLCRAWRPDVLLLDLLLPDVDGLTLLRRIKVADGGTPVIIVIGCATVAAAVDALTAGATSLVEKPIQSTALLSLLSQVREQHATRARACVDAPVEQLGGIVTRDPAMRKLFEMIRTTAPTSVNVLVHGENGSGKELVAGAIHALSPRAAAPFVKVNCAAIASELLESELFGHVRGAFTDAFADKQGLFELADRGSILLDEIGEMPLALQVKLLRVLQERAFRPVGSTRSINADFRLICATNVDPDRAMAEGRLRQDLYFRLNTIVLTVPPLRKRVGDIRLLASRFLETLSATYQRHISGFDEAALRLLERHAWPGNVRELEHVVERAVILARGPFIGVVDLPDSIRVGDPPPRQMLSLPSGCTLEELERLAILQTLELTSWNKCATANILGIHRPTLYNKLRKYRLWRRQDRFWRGDAKVAVD